MIVVIIAGGSGTRLWPLSTPEYPKHLLSINGEAKTLVQQTYERARLITNEVYMLTESSHAHHIREQIPELESDRIIIEPARRGTANCIVAALEELQKRHSENEPIATIPADHYIRDEQGFMRSFKLAEKAAQDNNRIVLVGVEPDHPATGFGYIKKGELFDDKNFIFCVDSFKEKPDYDTATKYLNSGKYLWNCGYFVGSIKSFKASMKKYAPGLLENLKRLTEAGDKYQETYLSFVNDAIEYALIEKDKDLLVVPATFDWMDLGSFGDLHKAATKDERGNHTHGYVELEEVENSFIQNHDANKPVAVVGLDNIVVINTKDGLLVARKDLAQKIGDVSKRIKGESA